MLHDIACVLRLIDLDNKDRISLSKLFAKFSTGFSVTLVQIKASHIFCKGDCVLDRED